MPKSKEDEFKTKNNKSISFKMLDAKKAKQAANPSPSLEDLVEVINEGGDLNEVNDKVNEFIKMDSLYNDEYNEESKVKEERNEGNDEDINTDPNVKDDPSTKNGLKRTPTIEIIEISDSEEEEDDDFLIEQEILDTFNQKDFEESDLMSICSLLEEEEEVSKAIVKEKKRNKLLLLMESFKVANQNKKKSKKVTFYEYLMFFF